MNNYKRGELAKEILKGVAITSFVLAMVVMPGLGKVAPLFIKGMRSREKDRIRQSIAGLQKKKLVRVYIKDGVEVVEITKEGKKRLLRYDLDEMKLVIPKKWDGWWRIVMFDIPENKKQARRAVSQKIKELGLYPIQKSVFVSPYLCRNEIDFVGEVFGVRENIIYIKAREIEGVKKLKQYFGIVG